MKLEFVGKKRVATNYPGSVVERQPALFALRWQVSTAYAGDVILSALGFLAGALVVILLWVWWLRWGRMVANEFAGYLGPSAYVRPRTLRWTERTEASERIQTPEEQARVGFWAWLPLVLFLPFLAVALLAGAVVRFLH